MVPVVVPILFLPATVLGRGIHTTTVAAITAAAIVAAAIIRDRRGLAGLERSGCQLSTVFTQKLLVVAGTWLFTDFLSVAVPPYP